MLKVAFKKVTSRGKKYVYLRGTNLALVTGFLGTDDELNTLLSSEAVSRKLADSKYHDVINPVMYDSRTYAAKVLHKVTKARASNTKRPYELSIEIIAKMLGDSYDRCEVTGIKFDYGPKTEASWQSRPLAPSLDRISNKGGYQRDNIRLVCVCVNVAINEWGLANFERMCRAFVGRNGK